MINRFLSPINFKLYKGTNYYSGVFLIIKSFNNLPNDFEDYPIQMWEMLISESKEILKKTGGIG